MWHCDNDWAVQACIDPARAVLKSALSKIRQRISYKGASEYPLLPPPAAWCWKCNITYCASPDVLFQITHISEPSYIDAVVDTALIEYLTAVNLWERQFDVSKGGRWKWVKLDNFFSRANAGTSRANGHQSVTLPCNIPTRYYNRSASTTVYYMLWPMSICNALLTTYCGGNGANLSVKLKDQKDLEEERGTEM